MKNRECFIIQLGPIYTYIYMHNIYIYMRNIYILDYSYTYAYDYYLLHWQNELIVYEANYTARVEKAL